MNNKWDVEGTFFPRLRQGGHGELSLSAKNNRCTDQSYDGHRYLLFPMLSA